MARARRQQRAVRAGDADAVALATRARESGAAVGGTLPLPLRLA